MIKFSVILPNYNHAPYLQQRIESILLQTFTDFELIILDDASSDNSREIINTFSHTNKISTIVFNDTNSGSPFRQWKKGVQLAKADWIWIAESDDFADPSFLAEAAKAIQQHPDIGIFYSDSHCKSETSKFLASNILMDLKNFFFKTDKWLYDYFIQGPDEVNNCLKYFCTINNSSGATFRKDLLLSALQDMNSFTYHGDWYAQIRIALQSAVYYSAKPLNTYRDHPGNFLKTQDATQRKIEYFRILDLLLKHKQVTEKKDLIDFYAAQYLGFGLLKDGLRHGRNLFADYSAINKPLARKVFYSMLLQKITGKKRREIF